MRLWLRDVVRLWEKGDGYMISSHTVADGVGLVTVSGWEWRRWGIEKGWGQWY